MTEGALIVVAMVDPASAPQLFRRRRLEWPLHVTVLPWFTVPDEAVFVEFLERHLPSEPAFQAVIDVDAAFGEAGEIPVSLVKNRVPFAAMHTYVLEAVLGQHGTVLMNTWIRDSYKPHVTHHGDNRLHQGDTFMVQSLTVVRLLDEDMCEVVTTIALGDTK